MILLEKHIIIGKKWIERHVLNDTLQHHVVKDQKWGVRNGPPNGITQRTSKKGGVERNYYDENGRQFKQISNNDHGQPKFHPFGNHGEHTHDYLYDKNGKLIFREARELSDEERKENSDIL